MATFTADVVSVGTFDAWVLGAGADKVAAVLRPDDVDASYIRSTTLNDVQSYFHNADALPFQEVSSGLTVHGRARKTSDNGSIDWRVRYGGTNVDFGPHTVSSTSYADFSDELADVPGGSGWTDQEIRDCEFGIELTNDPTGDVYCTTLYATFDANFAPQGFIAIAASLLPLLGPCLGLKDLIAMLNVAAIRRRVRVTAEELPGLLRDTRSYRFPVTVS